MNFICIFELRILVSSNQRSCWGYSLAYYPFYCEATERIFWQEIFYFFLIYFDFQPRITKNSTNHAFFWRKHEKIMHNSWLNLGFVRILASWLWHCMSSPLGTWLVVFLWVCVVPPWFGDLEIQLLVTLMLDRDVAIDCAPTSERRVECGSFLGWSFSNHGLRLANLGHILWSFSQVTIVQLCNDWTCVFGCVMTRPHSI